MNTSQLQIQAGLKTVAIEIQRSRQRKRTIAITIYPDRRIILKAPLRASHSSLENFTLQKTPWIVKTLKRIEAQEKQETLRPSLSPMEIFWLGRIYPIELHRSALLKKGGFCTLEENRLVICLPDYPDPEKDLKERRHLIRAWYQQEALVLFKNRADHFARLMNLNYGAIKVRDQKTRWGSCDRHGNLSLNWRVAMGRPDIIDYLIVHELCHIPHPDHSPKFWRAVEAILPDYRERRTQLKLFGRLEASQSWI